MGEPKAKATALGGCFSQFRGLSAVWGQPCSSAFQASLAHGLGPDPTAYAPTTLPKPSHQVGNLS